MVTGYDKTVIKHYLRYEISLPGTIQYHSGYDIRLRSSKQQHTSCDAWLPGTIPTSSPGRFSLALGAGDEVGRIRQHWGTIQYYSGYDIRLPSTIIHRSWANFLHPALEFALKLIPRSRNGPIFYTPF